MPATASRATPAALYSADELAAAARGLYTAGPRLRRKLQHWRPYVCPFERLLPHVPAGASVLDVGCGAGLFLALLAHSGRLAGGGRGVGVDISAGAIEMARRMVDATPTHPLLAGVLEFHALNSDDPPSHWPEGPFDVVSMIDVMHHIPPAAQRLAFDQAAERVSPGGVLLYKDMSAVSWRAAANRLHDLLLARQWIHYVPIGTIEAWAGATGGGAGGGAGLELVHSEEICRLWYAHQLRVFRRTGEQ